MTRTNVFLPWDIPVFFPVYIESYSPPCPPSALPPCPQASALQRDRRRIRGPRSRRPTRRRHCCLSLDLSLPSAVFRADAQLDPALLNKPACAPPLSEVHIRVPSADGPGARGLCTLAVAHAPRGAPVTVGDVLSALRDRLRQPEAITSADPDARRCHAKRVRTLNAYCAGLDVATRAETRRAEAAVGTRRVDCLRGKVLFAGITVEPQRWQLHLEFSERYAQP
ncbi:hypothetical protein B0H13DRAFT_161046 [Mycena leptocephala]|nr:hypothetical protein B0H13DRAFT_161046 [Mycena leptocephala]